MLRYEPHPSISSVNTIIYGRKEFKSILGITSLVSLKGPYITGLHLSFFAIYC